MCVCLQVELVCVCMHMCVCVYLDVEVVCVRPTVCVPRRGLVIKELLTETTQETGHRDHKSASCGKQEIISP